MIKRANLLRKMLKIGVPLRFVEWIKAWFTNRTARARVNGTTGRCRTFKEGLPQGSVLSPLLFTIYINDLLDSFESSTLVSGYADDLALACSGRNKEEVAVTLESEAAKVNQWATKNRLTLNTAKSEVAFFSMDAAESSWCPNITVGGSRLKTNPTPTFLGVRYDRRLTFNDHIRHLSQVMKQRANLLRQLTGTSWGWRPIDMRTIYIATVRSLAEYAAPAWAPWASNTNIQKLERTQSDAARAITGQLRSTPIDAVLHEAQIPSLSSRLQLACLRKADDWFHLPPNDDRRVLLQTHCPKRLKRDDWRNTTTPILSSLNLTPVDSEPVHIPNIPWPLPPPPSIHFTPILKSASPAQQLATAEETIAAQGPTDLHIFTDGSTLNGTENGGAGVIVCKGNTLIHSWHAPTGTFSSSFQAEKTALIAAITWLEQNDDWSSASIITDCKSLLQALSNNDITDPSLLSINSSIAAFPSPKSIRLIWVPGHCNLPGNDLADEQAKLGSALPQPTAPLDPQTRLAIIRRSCKPPPSIHPRLISLTSSRSNPEEESQLSKKDLVDLIRFRSGHHPSLRRWQHLTGKSEDDRCRLCGEDEESAEHLWLRCPALQSARYHRRLGFSFGELRSLPQASLALLRIILRRLE